MATKAKKTTEETQEPYPLYEAVRKVMLAGIGAVALTMDALEDLVDKLVERGELSEEEGRKLIKDMLERRKKDAKKAEEELNKRVDDLMARFDMPSKAEFDDLSAKIDALTAKVDELKQG